MKVSGKIHERCWESSIKMLGILYENCEEIPLEF